jgi:hypothetical protein
VGVYSFASSFSLFHDEKLAKIKCHINTILVGPSLALFPSIFKIKSFHSYGYAKIFFLDR